MRMILRADAEMMTVAALTLHVSLTASAIASAIAVPLGVFVGITRFAGRRAVVVLLNASMGLPTVAVGLVVYMILVHAPTAAFGPLFTPRAMIFAQALVAAPLIAALVRQTAEDGWNEYGEQLRSLGVGRLRACMTMMRELRYEIVIAALAGFGRAASEIGAVLIVGGNLAGYTRVMTTTIALETSKGNLPIALALGFILIGMIAAVNAIAYSLQSVARSRATQT